MKLLTVNTSLWLLLAPFVTVSSEWQDLKLIKGKVFLLSGKVASGKTTYARKMEKKGSSVLLSLDELQLSIFGSEPLREQLDESYEGCRNYQMKLALKLLHFGLDVYLDWGLWEKEARCALKQTFEDLGFEAKLIYFSVSLEKRMVWNSKRNKGNDPDSFKIESKDVEYFDSFYEEPSEDEYDMLVELY